MIRIALVLALVAGPLAAQEDAPLSAIDWLSDSVGPATVALPLPPLVQEPPITQGAAAPEVTVTPLGPPSPDSVGLLSPDVTGLPRSLWSASSEAVLADLIRAEPVETLPALQELLVTLMLVESAAPFDAGPQGALFLARIDKLLDLGALEPAQALLEQADRDQPEVFRRWFDVALLTGTEAEPCAQMARRPTLSPTMPARIFCLARSQDWAAAALTLATARALGQIGPEDEALLTRFLDPDLFDGAAPLPVPDRVTPLVFRLHEAIGETLATAPLPRAFAQADLRPTAAWRNQIEAAERLARVGAISENVLLAVYSAREPAASGGVWDRAAAMQAFEAALLADDRDALAVTLPVVWRAMQEAGTEVAFARLHGEQIFDTGLTGHAADLSFRIALLTPAYERVALARRAPQGAEAFLVAVARGQQAPPPPGDPRASAVAAAFAGAAVPAPLAALIAEGRLGEAVLRSLSTFRQGIDGEPRAVTDALATLRALGLEDVARRAALQYLILAPA